MRYNQPYNGSNNTPKSRAGKLFNPDSARHADEHIFDRDIATMISEMYPNSTFDDDDTTCEVLGQYFSFVTVEEVKELVMAAYSHMLWGGCFLSHMLWGGRIQEYKRLILCLVNSATSKLHLPSQYV